MSHGCQAGYEDLDSGKQPTNYRGIIGWSPASRPRPELIEWTPDTPSALIEHVCVNHRGADVPVSEQFLDRADVIAGLEKMSRE